MIKHQESRKLLASESGDKKVHYRLYKAHKQWLVASIAALTLGLGSLAAPGVVQAAAASDAHEVQATQETQQKTDQRPTDSSKEVTPTKKTDAEPAKAATQQTSTDKETDAENQTSAKAVVQTTKTVVNPTDQQLSEPVQPIKAKPSTATINKGQVASAKNDVSVLAAQSATKAQSPVAAKVVTTQASQQNGQTPSELQSAYDHAKDKADDANQSAKDNNDTKKDVQHDVNTDNGNTLTADQEKALEAAIDALKDKVNSFKDKQTSTDEAVKAYEALLKQFPNQPTAIKNITPATADQAKTLAAYDQLVKTYTEQVTAQLEKTQAAINQYKQDQQLSDASTTERGAQTALKAQADKFNQSIAAVVAQLQAHKGQSSDISSLLAQMDKNKADYQAAVTTYNQAVDAYNTQVNEHNHNSQGDQVSPIGGLSNPSDGQYADFKAAAQAAAKGTQVPSGLQDAYNAAQTAHKTLADAQESLTTQITKWQQASGSYNDGLPKENSDPTKVPDDNNLTTAQQGVTDAITQFDTANQAYQDKLTTYQNQLNETGHTSQQAAANNDQFVTAWNTFKGL